MAAALLDARVRADQVANPLAPSLAAVRRFFLEYRVHPVRQTPLDAACRDDFRPVHLDPGDASADPGAGRFAAVDFPELCRVPVHDSPCAWA
jgi:hypothetical protein